MSASHEKPAPEPTAPTLSRPVTVSMPSLEMMPMES